MTDRELMEKAAKAAGLEPDWSGAFFSEKGGVWNPLEDDGDALRLAVNLCMPIEVWGHAVTVDEFMYGDMDMSDPYAATRRAIVRAAARRAKAKP